MFVRTSNGQCFPVTSIQRLWNKTSAQGQGLEPFCLNGGAVRSPANRAIHRILDLRSIAPTPTSNAISLKLDRRSEVPEPCLARLS